MVIAVSDPFAMCHDRILQYVCVPFELVFFVCVCMDSMFVQWHVSVMCFNVKCVVTYGLCVCGCNGGI